MKVVKKNKVVKNMEKTKEGEEMEKVKVDKNLRDKELIRAVEDFYESCIEGTTVKNYIELCKVLRLTVCSSGRGKVRHLKKINECFDLERKGNSYKILGVKLTSEDIRNKKAKPRTIKNPVISKYQKYADNFFKILLLYMYLYNSDENLDTLGVEKKPNPEETLFFYMNSTYFADMAGMKNNSYTKEYSHVSSNMRTVKCDMFYKHNLIYKEATKWFWSQWNVEEETNENKVTPVWIRSKEKSGVKLIQKYKLIRDVIKLPTEAKVLTTKLRDELNKKESVRVKELKAECLKRIEKKYADVENDIERKKLIDVDMKKLEKKGNFNPRDVREIYGCNHEEVWATLDDILEILRIQDEADKAFDVKGRQHAKFSGVFKDYSQFIEERMINSFGFNKYEIYFEFSAPRSVLEQLIRDEIGVSPVSPVMNKVLQQKLFDLTTQTNEYIILDMFKEIDHRAKEVECGLKIDKRNGMVRADETVNKIKEEVEDSLEHTGNYTDIARGIVEKYIRLNPFDISNIYITLKVGGAEGGKANEAKGIIKGRRINPELKGAKRAALPKAVLEARGGTLTDEELESIKKDFEAAYKVAQESMKNYSSRFATPISSSYKK